MSALHEDVDDDDDDQLDPFPSQPPPRPLHPLPFPLPLPTSTQPLPSPLALPFPFPSPPPLPPPFPKPPFRIFRMAWPFANRAVSSGGHWLGQSRHLWPMPWHAKHVPRPRGCVAPSTISKKNKKKTPAHAMSHFPSVLHLIAHDLCKFFHLQQILQPSTNSPTSNSYFEFFSKKFKDEPSFHERKEKKFS